MGSSFTIAEDATATPSQPRSPLSPYAVSGRDPSPYPQPHGDSPPWTTIGRHGKQKHKHTGNRTSSTLNPRIPPPPDPDATLRSLTQAFRRAQQRWRAAEKGVAAGYAQIFSQHIPDPSSLVLDTVVCVALGSLSGTIAPPTLSNGARAVAGGYLREMSMEQLAALEAWIEMLRETGHRLPAAPSTMVDSSPSEQDTEAGDAADPFTTPSSFSLRGAKLIQDPCLNELDARFLRTLGYTVLPSDLRACSVASDLGPRPEHAASHVSPSTLFYAPHAPHFVVRAALLSKEVTGPGIYVGNELVGDDDDDAEGGSEWQVHRHSKKRPHNNSRSRNARSQDRNTDDEEGRGSERPRELTTEEKRRLALWKAQRTTIAAPEPSSTARRGRHDDAVMDTWVYVLKSNAGDDMGEDTGINKEP